MARMLLVGALFLICSFAHAQERAQPKLPTSELGIETATGRHNFTVEMALSPKQREIGLMFRDKMAGNEGMIFSTGKDEATSMWMKNTLLALDIVFIDADGVVTLVAENAAPQSLSVISSGSPVRAVLELKAGIVRKIGLHEGDIVRNVLFGNALK